MSDILNLLAQKIVNRQCVLFIGPGLFRENPGAEETLYESFSRARASEIDHGQMPYDTSQSGNIYYIIPRYLRFMNRGPIRTSTIADVRSNFVRFVSQKIAGNTLLQNLARLEFPIIINTNPDTTLLRYLPATTKTKFSYYDTSNRSSDDIKKQPVLTKDDFEPGRTVVYNLFGAYDHNPNSIVLTEDELLNYNSSVNGPSTRIPEELTFNLDNDKYYIFLGFHFDQWILKIVLRALGLPKGDDMNKITFTMKAKVPYPYIQHYFEDQFRFYFIPGDDVRPLEALVDDLLEACAGIRQNEPQAQRKENRIRKVVFLHHQSEQVDMELNEKLTHQVDYLKDSKVSFWSESFMNPSDDRKLGVLENLRNADVIMILVSSDMVADYRDRLDWVRSVYDERKDKPIVNCVLLRDYAFQEVRPLSGFNWLPKNEEDKVEAVTLWKDVDHALTVVAKVLKEQIDQIN